jgi:hypothetical protein
MNKHLKELAQRSGIMFESTKQNRIHSVSTETLKKFAELIVEECASKVDNILREKKDGGGTMGDDIREHFGVEE